MSTGWAQAPIHRLRRGGFPIWARRAIVALSRGVGGVVVGGQVGLVGGRPELRRQVAGIAAQAGVEVVAVAADARGADLGSPAPGCHVLLVDGGPDPGTDARGSAGPGGLGRWASAGDPQVETIVVHLPAEGAAASVTAQQVGASAVVELPLGSAWLAERLPRRRGSPILAVVGAVGGAGATTVALACAAAAGGGTLLVDADPLSTGLDLPLGIPAAEGGRWAAVPDTEEPLVAESLAAALPRVQGITVVTGPMPDPAGGRIAAVVRVGRAAHRETVVDCGRSPGVVPLEPMDAVVVVTPATLAGVVASRRVLDTVPVERVVVALRPVGWLPADEVAERLEVDALIEVPHLRRLAESAECGEVLFGRAGRDLARLGARVRAVVA